MKRENRTFTAPTGRARGVVFAALATFLLAHQLLAAQPQKAEEMRSWRIKQSGGSDLKGKLIALEETHMVIEDETGKNVRVPLWKLEMNDAVYLQRSKCRFPENMRAPEPSTGKGPLIDLSAADLPNGDLKRWANNGRIGGAFTTLSDPPQVQEIAGRKAVTFTSNPWNVKMDFKAMMADFYSPKCITTGKPFTLAAWLYNPETPAPREIFLCSRKLNEGGRGATFSYGGVGRYAERANQFNGVYSGPAGKLSIADKHFPAPNTWHQFAYVFTGGPDGELRLYVDGRIAAGNKFENAVPREIPNTEYDPEARLVLGSGWEKSWGAPAGARDCFTGSIAALQVYDAPLSEKEIRALCGPKALDNKPMPSNELLTTHFKDVPKADSFTPEFDGLIEEPWPKGLDIDPAHKQAKFMEGFGQPVITVHLHAPQDAMRIAIYSCERIMKKVPEIRQLFYVFRTANNTSNGEGINTSNEFACCSYGQSRNMLSDLTFYGATNMLMHEMGHQFHIFGGWRLDPDFNFELYKVFIDAMETGKWLADYGANNRWEYIAVCVNDWINDGGVFDTVYKREKLRIKDPKMYYFLKKYWSGDMVVELIPEHGLEANADGTVKTWTNRGGVEYWGKRGWARYRDTAGQFVGKGSPARATVDGVTAVGFGGSDALVWDCRTNDVLAGNHEWSVELWAWRPAAADAAAEFSDSVLLSFGDARFYWGISDKAYSLGDAAGEKWPEKPMGGEWRHITFVFSGKSLEKEEGQLTFFIDGEQQGEPKTYNISLAKDVPIVVGAALDGDSIVDGFRGAVAHARVYDYDMTPSQIKEHFRDEKPYYEREQLEVAGKLYIDLDARQLAPVPQGFNRPLYPESLKKDWVRSWFNRGALAGKVHNDLGDPGRSKPGYERIDGVQALVFSGLDRMVSIFQPDADMMAAGPGTLEAWVYSSQEDDEEESDQPRRRRRPNQSATIIEWDEIRLTAGDLASGWHHAAMIFEKDKTRLFIDGKEKQALSKMRVTSAKAPLHLGAHRIGKTWLEYFDGGLAQLRVHSGRLTPEQIQKNFRLSAINQPKNPTPADSAKHPPNRKLALDWDAGPLDKNEKQDVYFGTDSRELKKAGAFKPGEYAPSLEPDTTYHWRVVEKDGDPKDSGPAKAWSFTTCSGKVIDLDAQSLAEGKLASWQNKGAAGGKFAPADAGNAHAPFVETVVERKGARFAHGKFLTSSFDVPDQLKGGKPFTIFLRALSIRNIPGTMLSWGNRATGSAEFYFPRVISQRQRGRGQGGNTNADAAFRTGKDTRIKYDEGQAPVSMLWNDIAYVYDPKDGEGSMKVYVNGQLRKNEKLKLAIGDAGRINVGMAENRSDPFAGLLSDLDIYDTALSDEQITAMWHGKGKQPDKKRLLVSASTDSSPDGDLAQWKNRGSLGGAFTCKIELASTPKVGKVKGRKAVVFDGKENFLSSSIDTPDILTGAQPFTIVVDYCGEKPEGKSTVFALAPETIQTGFFDIGDIERAAEVRYDTDGRASAFRTGNLGGDLSWKDQPPTAGEWHRVTYVYTGGRRGQFRIYVDGEHNNTKVFTTFGTPPGNKMHIGASWTVGRGEDNFFTGAISRIAVYDYAFTDKEAKRLPK
ncbi:LamG-like jellyroll fold domain-containing protein [Candidatus Sumerlaeota bacterium]